MAGKVRGNRRRRGRYLAWTDKKGKLYRCDECGKVGRGSPSGVRHKPGCTVPNGGVTP